MPSAAAVSDTVLAVRSAAAPAALPVDGFDAVEAVWRLLRLHGHDGGLQAFREAHDLRGTAESLAEPLERAGVQARPALVAADELAYLDLPTLLQLRDGTWVVLVDRERDALRLEGASGGTSMAAAELGPFLSGYVLDVSPSLPDGKGLWSRLLALLLHHRRTLVMLALASLLLQLLSLVGPEITGAVMNQALPDRARSTLHVVALGVVLVAAFQACTGLLRDRVLLFLVTRMEVSAERGILQHLLRLPFPVLDRMTLGERLQAINGVSSAREVIAERALATVLDGVMAVTFVAAMAAKMPAATLLVVVVAMVMAGLALLVGSAQARHQRREMEAQARERGLLSELITGVGTIKAAGAEPQALQRWVRRFSAEQDHALRRQRLGLFSDVGLETMRQGLYVALLVWGGSLMLQGELLVGTLLAFVQLSSGFLGSVFSLVRVYLSVAVLRPQLERTQEILGHAPERRSTRRAAPGARGVPVVMEGVWFRHAPDAPWIAKGYSRRFEAGAKEVISGASGFGKSTLIRMLAGLYAPEEGAIHVGGTSPQAAAGDILYLPQFVSLFSGSVIENLRLLSGGAPVARLMEAAEQTGLAALVATLPMGYQTVLSPGGKNVSGGQRQLIALTAAIASDRKLLLLDEALSNLDPIRARSIRKILDALPATIIEARHAA
ncbi:ABC transporter transmembrane domain-containing protein [Anaeromyxobacter terrae]|uniref:ABC transporter transmembrane domain-containing protein n=1 Tax=Anaeromyxobacter terrae TaxID=2925406 RepID=UPI001F57D65E|nr:ABC transporter transmembrane domain-containing protein [Anaeromyxobacter sp. SG22]